MVRVLKVVLIAVLVIALISACAPAVPSTTKVSVSELSTNAKAYVGKTITVEGVVANYIGNGSSTLIIPKRTARPCGKAVCFYDISKATDVEIDTFTFSADGATITVAEKIGGTNLPIAANSVPKDSMEVNGVWIKDNDGNYYLYID